MKKYEIKRFLSMLLCLLMIVGLFPNTAAYAANNNLNVLNGQITVEYTGNTAQASVANDELKASATAKVTSGCTGESYAAETTTLKITNASGAAATMVFNYAPQLNGGSMTLNGKAVTGNGTFSEKVEANGTVTIVLTSPGDKKTPATVVLNNFALVGDGEVAVTFVAPVNGSITVNGNAVTSDTTVNTTYANGVTVTATANEGYEFAGWVDANGAIVLKDASGVIKPTRALTVKPWFVASGSAMFGVGSRVFDDLNEAATAAENSPSNKTVILLNSGTVAAGEYTIPKGVTLLIPFDEAGTCYKASPEVVNTAPKDQKVFRKMTMADGANLVVNGELSVSAKYATAAGGRPMGVLGNYGQIELSQGSTITINSGAALYAWGYITGPGHLTAKSGSTVYELFQLTDFRGGSASMTCLDTNKKHFVFGQYYVQNIESAITYETGATEFVNAAVTAGGRNLALTPKFIGNGGLFVLKGGTLTKWYDPQLDQLQVDVDGTVELNSITVTFAGVNANSADYNLPINNVMIHVRSGELTNGQKVEFLPDSGLKVYPGATLNVTTPGELYLIDKADWGNYYWNNGDKKLSPLVYSPTRGANHRTGDTMKSAVLDINGTVNVNGLLNTSTSGADVISTAGGGIINFNSADKAGHVWHYSQQPNSWTEIPVVSAKLKNADGTFVETAKHAANTSYTYNQPQGEWVDPDAVLTYTVTWKNEDGTVLETDVDVAENTIPTYDGAEPVKAEDDKNTYTFAGWTPEIAPVTGDITYTASFKAVPKTATITWQNEDGTVIDTTTVNYGEVPTHAEPSKAPDENNTYTFAGWTPELTAVTGDATYKATFTAVPKTATIIWKDEDGTVLETDEKVAYGTTPVYNGAEPTKAEDASGTYSFSGWSPEIVPVSGDATYTAVYQKTGKTYTVTWKNDNGNVLETDENVAYGAMPSYDGATPAKSGNAQFSYTFSGWSPKVDTVKGDVTYTATFTKTTNTYTVTWLNEADETGYQQLLETDVNVPYGAMPSYDGEVPSKEGDEQYSYTFAGWTPQISAVTGDISYTATYTPNINKYTVTWVNWDDTILEEDFDVAWGSIPEYNGVTPEKPGDAQYRYEFNGWEMQVQTSMMALNPEKPHDLSAVTSNVIYKATFKPIVNEYTITWFDEDGQTVLATTQVPYGTVPTYDGIPTKEGDEQYSYTFAGWDPQPVAVTGPDSYIATYTQAVNSYTVTWNNYDGSQLGQQTLRYGETPVYSGPEPVKQGDAQYTYKFAGWDVDVAPVTCDITYTAVFSESINSYTVTWCDENGTVLESNEVPYGQMPGYNGSQPTKEADEQYSYTFAGWTPEIVKVTGNATYTATYTATLNEYTVTWIDAEGTVLAEEIYKYDELPVYKGQTPSKAGDAQYSYTFTGWTPAVDKVNGNITYKAVYQQSLRSYTVTWYDDDGKTVLATDTVTYGSMPNYTGEVPSKAADNMQTYEFAGWTPELSVVTGDVAYKAKYTAHPIEYNVTWLNDDGTVLKSERVQAGTMPCYDGVPTKEATAQYTYTFKGWTPEVSKVTSDATYTAVYENTVNTYTVTWTDDNGKILETDENVAYGTKPEFNGTEPVKADTAQYSYKFTGWTPEIMDVTGNVTYKAVYESTVKSYTVNWLSEDGKTVLATQTLDYGTIPVYPETAETPLPTKDKDEFNTYEFAGWEPEITSVVGDADYKAKFTAVPIMHNVKWVNDDGTVIAQSEFKAGTEPVLPEGVEQPSKAQDAQYMYTFTGWKQETDPESGDVTFTAQYEATIRSYAVKFQNEDGSIIYATLSVKYGDTPSYDAAEPTMVAPDMFHKYNFTGWTPALAPVAGEQTYTAQFELVGLTGWFEVTDEAGVKHTTYAENGVPYISTWADVPTEIQGETGTVTENKTYYFDENGYIVKGIQNVPARNDESRTGSFVFDEETGIFQADLNGPYRVAVVDAEGQSTDKTKILWTENGEIVPKEGLVLHTEKNEYYYFENGEAVKSDTTEPVAHIVVNNNDLALPAGINYAFDGNGVIVHDVNTSLNGMQPASDEPGSLYLFVDGVKICWGLFEYPANSGNYYYARTSSGAIVRNQSYWITQLNGFGNAENGIAEGSYQFEADGKMIVPDPNPTKNGIVAENGGLYYYENGELSPAGLIKIGEDYYYVRTSTCEVITNRAYWVTKTNGLLPEGQYEFGADGKLVLPPVDPEPTPPVTPEPVKNGIVAERGSLYYYENGKLVPAGLVEIEGNYYYVRTSNGEVIHGRSYWVTKTNGYPVPVGSYQFDDTGKMINAPVK